MFINVKKLNSKAKLPERATATSAGADLCACIDDDVVLMPGDRKLIPTGLYVELPQGIEAQVRARSGLSIKHGIGLVNGVGTVDSDYRGEWNVPLINFSDEPYTINDGDRIAQVVFSRYERASFESVEKINETERGDGGFGHTGIK